MIEKQRVLSLIPARGGSKGIKDKNIYPLLGKPLIAYTIEAALKSKYIDSVIVSTDSEKIAEIAKNYGANVPFIRPMELANDTSKTIDAILHAIEWLKSHDSVFDILVLLQPTSPLRTVEDIDQALEKFLECGKEPLVSVSKVNENPVLIRTINNGGTLDRLLPSQSTVRRQDMETYYCVNGSIYINMISEINPDTSFNDNKIPFIVLQKNAVDIDELKDIAIAEWYLSGGKNGR